MNLLLYYLIVIESLIYVKVCTQFDISYVVGVLDRYLNYLHLMHWKTIKRYDICSRYKGYVDISVHQKT